MLFSTTNLNSDQIHDVRGAFEPLSPVIALVIFVLAGLAIRSMVVHAANTIIHALAG